MVCVGKECSQLCFKCTVCRKFIGKWCIVVYVVVDGSRCKRCDGTIQEADLAKDLVMDGGRYGSVKSFCFL